MYARHSERTLGDTKVQTVIRPVASLQVAFGRDRSSVRGARQLLEGLLRASNVPSDVLDDLLLATSEAVSNAVVHGGGDQIDVAVRVRSEGVEIRVIDTGPGYKGPDRAEMPDPTEIGGRGIPIMATLVDELQVLDGPDGGTEVILRRALQGDL